MRNSTNPETLRLHAQEIWKAGVDAVTPRRLFADKVHCDGRHLELEDVVVDLRDVRRLVVVGAGKASAAMASELERILLPKIDTRKLELTGWVNCPEGTFQDPLKSIHLHAARPAGVNAPTEKAVAGTQRILELVRDCDQRDVVLCLISGGGSALLVAPSPGIDLSDKQNVAKLIAAAGGNIEQLNAVRRAISEVKGGGLARHCKAGRLISLVISDVIGDPLETIASGPTIISSQNGFTEALTALDALQLGNETRLENVVRFLKTSLANESQKTTPPAARIQHVMLGNNADAVDAAGIRAVELGYRYVMQAAREPESDVMQVAETAAQAIIQLASQTEIDCWISGGEPTVSLPADCSGVGGRNQQLTLAVMQSLMQRGWPEDEAWESIAHRELVFLSGGTDGEDGPTDAAGAWFEYAVWKRSRERGLQPLDYLRRADAYRFFESAGGLILTGPTGTNVCDLRVALCATDAKDRT